MEAARAGAPLLVPMAKFAACMTQPAQHTPSHTSVLFCTFVSVEMVQNQSRAKKGA